MDDEEIITRCLEGDQAGFACLASKYGEMVHAYAYHKLGNHRAAEDIAQEVFTKVHRKLGHLRNVDSFQGWLYVLASNECEMWTELERMYRELENARQIQKSFLPENPPRIKGFEIAGTSIPAKEVSGDFYDYLSLGKNIGIVVADVTGKSVKAAMVAAMANGMLHTEIRERRDVWTSPSRILTEVNTGLQPRLIRGMFTAMSLGILQPADKRLLLSNAGMPYPIVKRGKKIWELEVNGLPLGLMTGAEYQDLSFETEEGDLMVFYSDGVIEATNGREEIYQTERLLRVLQQADPDLSAQEIVDMVAEDVTAFAGDMEQSDDITVVAARCT
jgi:sigma-B regulation protein RsbU (phosphoserine phosphatase)